MNKNKPTKTERIQHEEEYVAFLKKRLGSTHFIANTSKDEVEKTKQKLAKARLVLKILRTPQ